ncbi:MAG TPA: efflux RND transporter periplasmic adaptor subunit [Thermoanaerobaculia bacterium]|nr:efflux RND transporter periplasmic adaptor subunit [Thermoanaerobaculia bacterium]
MQMTKRRAALIGGFAGAIVLAGLAFRPKPVPVETFVATVGSLRTTVDEDARTRVPERYEISSPVAGHHMRIQVHPGDPVNAGDALVRIEAAPLDPRQLDELQARLRAAEDLAREASAAERQAEIMLAQAGRDGERIERLSATGVASTNDLEQARTTAANRLRELQAARSRASASRHDADVIRASLAAASPQNPGTLVLRAPVSGRVLTVYRESESVVTAGVPILDIGDPSTLEVVIDALSREAVKVVPGQEVAIDGWGGERPLSAIVTRIESSAFTKISALGIEEQRVNVIALLRDPPPSLGDRFEVQAHVITWSGNTLKVPSTAVFRDGERWAVFRVRGGRAGLQHIGVGHRSADEVEVTSGLAAGDPVIVHASDQVHDGVRVTASR